MIHLQATGQHKNKAGLTHSPVYYPFASTHMVNTQLLHVPNVHTKYRKYFRGFLNSCLPSFARNSRKLTYRKYYDVYSNCFGTCHALDLNWCLFQFLFFDCRWFIASWRHWNSWVSSSELLRYVFRTSDVDLFIYLKIKNYFVNYVKLFI